MWLLQGKTNIVKKFYWNYINDDGMSIQSVPVLRLHSAQIHLVPLKMMIIIRVGQIHRPNSQQNHSGHCPLTFRRLKYTHLWEAQEERMTVKHHTSITALLHLVFSCCISQRWSHCLWWRLTGITTGAWTVLTMGLLPKLM